MVHKTFTLSLLLTLALALAACGGSPTPQLIGSYPQGGGEPPVAYYEPAPAPQLTITYNASLEIEVENTQQALYNVQWIAAQHSGYLLNSRTWHEGNLVYGEATIAVPVSHFEAARSALRSLGAVLSESVSGELQTTDEYAGGWEGYSNITVTLRPASANWGHQVGKFLAGVLQFVFWAAAILVPPTLMIIGFFTVLGWARNWLNRRSGN